MDTEKPDWQARANKLAERSREINNQKAESATTEDARLEDIRPEINADPAKSKSIPYKNRICPFLSDSQHDVNCTARCKLFRDQKDGYNCPIPEIFAISWKLGGSPKKR